jgi:hypothetical protein
LVTKVIDFQFIQYFVLLDLDNDFLSSLNIKIEIRSRVMTHTEILTTGRWRSRALHNDRPGKSSWHSILISGLEQWGASVIPVTAGNNN